MRRLVLAQRVGEALLSGGAGAPDQGLLPVRWRRGATSSILTRRCDSSLDRPDIVMTFPDIAADHMTSRIAFEGTGEIRVVNIELAIEDRDRRQDRHRQSRPTPRAGHAALMSFPVHHRQASPGYG